MHFKNSNFNYFNKYNYEFIFLNFQMEFKYIHHAQMKFISRYYSHFLLWSIITVSAQSTSLVKLNLVPDKITGHLPALTRIMFNQSSN